MRLQFRLVVVVSTFLPASLLAGEKPTAKELVEQYRKSVGPLDRARVVSSFKPLFDAPPLGTASSLHEMVLVRDGSRMKVDWTWTLTNFKDPGRPMSQGEQQSIGKVVDNVYTHLSVQPTMRPDRPNVSEFRDGDDRRLWQQMGAIRLVFGRMEGDGAEPLWKVMSEASTLELDPQTEQIDGVETFVVTSRGKYGKHRVWFDPAKGALPRRIEVQKLIGDLCNDEQLGARPAAELIAQPQKGARKAPDVAIQEVVYRVDNVRIEEKQSTFVVMAFDTSIQMKVDGNQVPGQRGELRVETVELYTEPLQDAVFQFDAKIPNGTPVAVFNKRPLIFANGAADHLEIWIDGRVQPKPGQ